MELPQDLVTEIASRLGPLAGHAMVIGSTPLAAALAGQHPEVAVLSLDPWTRRTAPTPRTIAGDASELPLAPRSLSALFAVEALSRYAAAEPILASWRQALRPTGWIVIIERLIQSATMRALRRLISAQRYQAPPEQLTALLLNAGFSAVGQSWPAVRTRMVITVGRRASFE